jgi:hypothetical protein
MAGRELYAEIAKSGTWLYDGSVPSEVWIVKQDFQYHYEEGYSRKTRRKTRKTRTGKPGQTEMTLTPARLSGDRIPLCPFNSSKAKSRKHEKRFTMG